MDRESKVVRVKELKEAFAGAKFAAAADYCGLKVAELEKLRVRLREQNARIQVAKNTLLRIAAQGTEYEELAQAFTGTTAVAFSFDEPVGSAKVLVDFGKEHETLRLRSAMFEGRLLSAEDLTALAQLPGRPQLLGQLCGVLAAVPTKLVRTLNAAPSKLVYALQAVKEQKEQ